LRRLSIPKIGKPYGLKLRSGSAAPKAEENVHQAVIWLSEIERRQEDDTRAILAAWALILAKIKTLRLPGDHEFGELSPDNPGLTEDPAFEI